MCKTLALIPARAGSKRVPGKNLRPLLGKPLIQWTLEAALEAEGINDVVVSTDSEAIASIAQACGALVPFMRPDALASDTATTQDVIEHALDELAKQGSRYERIVLLQPTSPLRTSKHIDEALTLFEQKNANSVISVSPAEHPPQWINRLGPNGEMDAFLDAVKGHRRSQAFGSYYQLNGAIYIAWETLLLKHHSFFMPKGTYAYVLSQEEGVDIDTEVDWYVAEALMMRRGYGQA